MIEEPCRIWTSQAIGTARLYRHLSAKVAKVDNKQVINQSRVIYRVSSTRITNVLYPRS